VLSVSARVGGRSVVREQFTLNTYLSNAPGGALTLPLLVHSRFCSPVTVDAELLVRGKPLWKVTATADFQCGE
ncbi:MAG TPA: hypothetical protein VHM70_28085, partial [Polyangiaceae bacterium]|nr:hypothetical protein [Polyangiaceae bacterium]